MEERERERGLQDKIIKYVGNACISRRVLRLNTCLNLIYFKKNFFSPTLNTTSFCSLLLFNSLSLSWFISSFWSLLCLLSFFLSSGMKSQVKKDFSPFFIHRVAKPAAKEPLSFSTFSQQASGHFFHFLQPHMRSNHSPCFATYQNVVFWENRKRGTKHQ